MIDNNRRLALQWLTFLIVLGLFTILAGLTGV